MSIEYPMPNRPRPATLPGDRALTSNVGTSIDAMIRVDQAGELGAREIYSGQMVVLKDQPSAPLLAEMAAQEAAHLAKFDALVVERGVRPSILSPLWRAAGYGIGVGSALLGERAAMAVTVAVEEVIEQHYQEQLDALDEIEADEGIAELRACVAEFRADELAHRDLAQKEMALKKGAKEAPAYQILSRGVKAGTKLAIGLAKRF
ncbi:MAG: demethoxyubiquinone hydroxylase family protein [Alphaproteobacteria bacterium]|nr:demethoxyubiquinone hydroxylase family protein [Alphaproteobacteria bacterium]